LLVLKEEGISSPPPFRFAVLMIQFVAFLFAGFLSFGKNSDLSRACSRSLTLKNNQLHLSPFTVVDRPLSPPAGRIYGGFKKDGFKPRSILLHQPSAATHPSSSTTDDSASQRRHQRSFPVSRSRRVVHTRLRVDLTRRQVGPTRCSVRLRHSPPTQLLLFELFLLRHVTVFLFMLFLCFFFVCFLSTEFSAAHTTVPFRSSAAHPLQQPRRCCLHSNEFFIEFVCTNRSGLFTEFHCTQSRVARPWDRPGGPCLVLAIACSLVLLNQIQILPIALLLLLVLLFGFVVSFLAVSQLFGCLSACSVSCLFVAVLS